jgi:hypothetical protein
LVQFPQIFANYAIRAASDSINGECRDAFKAAKAFKAATAEDPREQRARGGRTVLNADIEKVQELKLLKKVAVVNDAEEEDIDLDSIPDILDLSEDQYPRFTLAKNKARFLRMVSWYKNKQEWLEVAPLSGVTKLFKQQTKELVGIRSSKLDYEMELETGTLTPSQRSYRRDELKMCKVHEKMAVNLISKMQVKIKSGRR